jgi:hypothetical protein
MVRWASKQTAGSESFSRRAGVVWNVLLSRIRKSKPRIPDGTRIYAVGRTAEESGFKP